jgi:plasmid replication initiation protein
MTNQNNNHLIVQQSNQLIESRHDLSIIEKKLIHIAIATYDRTGFHNRVELKRSELEYHLGFTNYKGFTTQLKVLATKLMGRVISLPAGNGNFKLSHWLNNAEYDEKTEVFSFKWDETLSPHIALMKEKFTRFDLQYTMGMQSAYSIRLYEHLKKDGWQVSLRPARFSLVPGNPDMPYLGDCLGYSGKSYEQWGNVNRRIISYAVNEINEMSDLDIISVTPLKNGKKVLAIEIKYLKKTKDKLMDVHTIDNDLETPKPKPKTVNAPLKKSKSDNREKVSKSLRDIHATDW